MWLEVFVCHFLERQVDITDPKPEDRVVQVSEGLLLRS